jgi:hypothetical protein
MPCGRGEIESTRKNHPGGMSNIVIVWHARLKSRIKESMVFCSGVRSSLQSARSIHIGLSSYGPIIWCHFEMSQYIVWDNLSQTGFWVWASAEAKSFNFIQKIGGLGIHSITCFLYVTIGCKISGPLALVLAWALWAHLSGLFYHLPLPFVRHCSNGLLCLVKGYSLCFFFRVDSGVAEVFTTNALLQKNLLLHQVPHPSFWACTVVGHSTNSKPKVEASTVFCHFKYHMIGSQFTKISTPVCELLVMWHLAWLASTKQFIENDFPCGCLRCIPLLRISSVASG